jgi:aminopeptidase N
MRWILVLAALLALGPNTSAQRRRSGPQQTSGGVLSPEQAAFDVLHYALALRVDPQARRIEGRLEMTARLEEDAREIALDLDSALTLEQVLQLDPQAAKPQKLSARRVEGRIFIPLEGVRKGAEFRLALLYSGEPHEARHPPWDGGFTWAKTKADQPWIATSCQGEGADLWWPCKDHPSDEPDSFSLRVAVPEPLVVASNGRLVEVTPGSFAGPDRAPSSERGWRTYHWEVSTPINNYGVALAIAPFETLTAKMESPVGGSYDFTFWVLPKHLEQAKAVFGEFQRELSTLEELCGPYPFRADKAGVAEVPFLGMEHQSIIAYGAGFRGDTALGFDYDWLFQHELSHEWWGNLVTARDWKDFWIHEGIGTYMQALYLERRFGAEAGRKKLAADLAQMQNRGAVAPRDARTTKEMYFSPQVPDAPDIDVYVKGAWICHGLRWLLGDEMFFKVLRRWAYPDPALESTTDGSACRLTDSEELIAIAEKESGLELGWYFDLYLRQPELPRLDARESGRTLELAWKTPRDLPFPMPVEVQIGERRARVEMKDGRGRIEVGGERWSVDPDAWLLRVHE